MQSAVPHVLSVLDRVHQPGRPEQCAAWARAAGFEHVSLDLIYGTPGESDADWERSLRRALAAGPDHISAYALIVEDGTRLAARIRRGELPAPDDDVLADRYLAADELLGRGRPALVRDLQLGGRPESALVPAQPAVLDRRRLVGHRAGRAQPRRRAPAGGTSGTRPPTPQRLAAGASPGQAREILTAAERRHRADHAGDPAGLRAARSPTLRPGRAGRPRGGRGGRPGRARERSPPGGLILTTRGRLLADAVIRA